MLLRYILYLSIFLFASAIETNRYDALEALNTHARYRRAASKTHRFTDLIRQGIVEAHNQVRRDVKPSSSDMRKMYWDDSLAKYASTLSSQCDANARLPTANDLRISSPGISKLITTRPFDASFIGTVIKDWLNQRNKYEFREGSDQCSAGLSGCNLYKQMIWGTTFLIGCGASTCSRARLGNGRRQSGDVVFFYCLYGPRGNGFLELPYQPGPSCSKCEDPRDTCENKLCDNKRRLNPRANADWLKWGKWSACSRTCGGGGRRQRNRKCNTYVADDCTGTSVQSQILCAPFTRCPTSARATWTRWANWGSCTLTCGEGTRLRRRSCQSNGAGSCLGPSVQLSDCSENRSCTKERVLIEPAWLRWQSWSECSKTCGGGTRIRRRRCSVRRSTNSCIGRSSQTQNCNIERCPRKVPSGWANWRQWSSCSAICGVTGVRRRTRVCRGTVCPGESRSERRCKRVPCPPQQNVWGSWSQWSSCNASCGGGFRRRRRLCGGTACRGNAKRRQRCNTKLCPAVLSPWGAFSRCTVTCGTGKRTRTRTCSRPGACTKRLSRTRNCNSNSCPRS